MTVTTNGSQLARFASELADCGVRRVNVSLDTLDPGQVSPGHALGRSEASSWLASTPPPRRGSRSRSTRSRSKGFNEDEALGLVKWAHGRGFDLTFIEVMPLGDMERDRADQFLPLTELRARLENVADPHPFDLRHRRPGALLRCQGNRRAPRVHHAAYAQFLRKLQSGARHLHGHALYVSRPGGCGRICASRSAAPLPTARS